MSVKLLTEYHLEVLSLRGGSGTSESALVKMPHCLKSHVAAHMQRSNVDLSKSKVGRSCFGIISSFEGNHPKHKENKIMNIIWFYFYHLQLSRVFTVANSAYPDESKKESKDQESIQSSTTPDPAYQ